MERMDDGERYKTEKERGGAGYYVVDIRVGCTLWL